MVAPGIERRRALLAWNEELEGRLGITQLELIAHDVKEPFTVGDVFAGVEARCALLQLEAARDAEFKTLEAAILAERTRAAFEAFGARVGKAVRP